MLELRLAVWIHANHLMMRSHVVVVEVGHVGLQHVRGQTHRLGSTEVSQLWVCLHEGHWVVMQTS